MTTAFALVTGSRDHRDRGHIWSVLDATRKGAQLRGFDRLVVVHGAARGADSVAEAWVQRNRGKGVSANRFRAEWESPCTEGCKPGHRKTRADGVEYCPSEGGRRNQRMVDHVRGLVELDAVLTLGFLVPDKACSGTRDCLRRAKEAGLPLSVWVGRERVASW